MTLEQLTDIVLRQTSEIAAWSESTKNAHRRIDENDRITESIHKLAANVEALALQVKLLTESMESSLKELKNALKSQGERIGALEKEPAHKWKALVAQVITLSAAAAFGGLITKLGG